MSFVYQVEKKRKPKRKKAAGTGKKRQILKAKKKASFGKGKKRNKAAEVAAPEPSVVHGKYNLVLLGLPAECYPDSGRPNKGAHSYTIRSESGARVEVLLRSRAFFVKQGHEGMAEDCKGQVSWGLDVAEAWRAVKERCGW